ncbi:MAG TPA: YggT family protein [Acidobacteriota bacterium]|jgi:YggT family protein|nr:YggT family protein [Acidobacteriota bacterium]
MFVVGNLLNAVASVLDVVLQGLLLVILVDAVLSWVGPGPRHPVVRLLDRISDFVCDPVRRLFPTAFGGIDFAPFIAMLAIYFVQLFVIGSLHGLAVRLG